MRNWFESDAFSGNMKVKREVIDKMTMGEKIINLRKREGYSQEMLAELLNVSRQSVSKWELNVSVPDLNRIIQMSELFHVSTDYLLKENVAYVVEQEMIRSLNDEEVQVYLDLKRKEKKSLPAAICLCILGAANLIGTSGLSVLYPSMENQLAAAGIIILLVLVTIGVSMIISNSMKLSKFEWLEKEPVQLHSGMLKYIRELKENYAPTHAKFITLGVCLCILSVIPLIMTTMLAQENEVALVMSVVVLLLIVMVGVYILVYDGIWQGALDMLLQEGEYSPTEKVYRKKYSFFSGLYWCALTAVYLVWSFTTNDWEKTWIVFAAGGVLYGGLATLIKGLGNK